MNLASESSQQIFTAVSRGPAAAVFPEGEQWTVHQFPAGDSRVDVTFRTGYVSSGFESTVPRWLCAEVNGAAASLEDAIRRFPNAVRALTPMFDVALNASVGDLDLHIGFNDTPALNDREFFQNFLRDEPATLRQVRPVHKGFLGELTNAVARHPDSVRLHRSAAHYQQALRFWSLGDETRAVGQLWMGFEALTPRAKHQEMERTGSKTPVALADALKIDLKNLDATLRLSILFKGDEHAYKQTKKVSDGFEHGFIPLDELRSTARTIRNVSAAHLRRSIIELSGVPHSVSAVMLAEPYDVPIIAFPIVKYLRGRLKGSGDLAAPGQRYPLLRWESTVSKFRRRDDGLSDVAWNENLTAKLGAGIELTDVSIEMWSGDPVLKDVEHRITSAVRRNDVEH